MTMTSLLWRHLYLVSQSVSQCSILLDNFLFFYNTQVLNCIASYDKSEQVQQANVFKRQTLTFHFQRIIQINLNIYDDSLIQSVCDGINHLSRHTPVRLYERIDCCDRCIVVETTRRPGSSNFFLTNNTFSAMSKLFVKHL